MLESRRSRKFLSLKDRLSLYANEVRGQAKLLPPGLEREALLKKAHQADAAANSDDWVGSQLSEPQKP